MKNSIRLEPSAYEHLKQLAKTSGESMQSVLEKAIEAYRMRKILKDPAHSGFLNDPVNDENPPKSKEDWDVAIADDLDD